MCMYVIEIYIWIVRAMLLEQYNQRTHEARSLASDFPTNPPTLSGSSQNEGAPMTFTIRSTSAPPSGSAHRYLLQQQSDPDIKESLCSDLAFELNNRSQYQDYSTMTRICTDSLSCMFT